MKLPFETHKIYITLDDSTLYELNPDFSKKQVSKEEILSVDTFSNSKKPFMVLHKKQFEYGKSYLMNKDNPNRITKETAETYFNMGFINKEELQDFVA